jgi:hypothetical protein
MKASTPSGVVRPVVIGCPAECAPRRFPIVDTWRAAAGQAVEELDRLAVALLVERVADHGVGAAAGLAVEVAVAGGEGQLGQRRQVSAAAVEVLPREHRVDVALLVGVAVARRCRRGGP